MPSDECQECQECQVTNARNARNASNARCSPKHWFADCRCFGTWFPRPFGTRLTAGGASPAAAPLDIQPVIDIPGIHHSGILGILGIHHSGIPVILAFRAFIILAFRSFIILAFRSFIILAFRAFLAFIILALSICH